MIYEAGTNVTKCALVRSNNSINKTRTPVWHKRESFSGSLIIASLHEILIDVSDIGISVSRDCFAIRDVK